VPELVAASEDGSDDGEWLGAVGCRCSGAVMLMHCWSPPSWLHSCSQQRCCICSAAHVHLLLPHLLPYAQPHPALCIISPFVAVSALCCRHVRGEQLCTWQRCSP
jgi:hypothetical protein